MLFQIPVFCARCNTVYPSGLAMDDGASKIGIFSSEYICPRGHSAAMLDGMFDVRDGVVTITTEAGSEPVLETIRKLAAAAVAGETDADDAVKAIEAIAPSLGPIIKLAGKNNALLALALILWFIVEMTKATHPQVGETKAIHIENRPVILNQIVTGNNATSQMDLSSGERRIILPAEHTISKRKRRRLRGEARHEKNRQAVKLPG